MAKQKREWVRTTMLERLRRNRTGRLTPEQWLSITTEPLTTILLLAAPVLLIVGLRLPLLAARGWLLLVFVLLGILAMLLFRARRYARTPVNSRVLYAAQRPLVRQLLSQTSVFHDDEGNVYRFSRWLAPRITLIPGQSYLTYSLQDAQDHVLCSLIPTDDPEAASLQPTPELQRRLERVGAHP